MDMAKRGGPSADEVKAARVAAGLTQAEAAALVCLRAQQRWGEYESGARTIDPARWELFRLKTAQLGKADPDPASPDLPDRLVAEAHQRRGPLRDLLAEAAHALRARS